MRCVSVALANCYPPKSQRVYSERIPKDLFECLFNTALRDIEALGIDRWRHWLVGEGAILPEHRDRSGIWRWCRREAKERRHLPHQVARMARCFWREAYCSALSPT